MSSQEKEGKCPPKHGWKKQRMGTFPGFSVHSECVLLTIKFSPGSGVYMFFN